MRRLAGQLTVVLALFLFLASRAHSFEEFSARQGFLELMGKIKTLVGPLLDAKDKGNLLTLTNASFVKVGGEETVSFLDLIHEEIGCSPGRGNLLALRSRPDRPLYLFFFNREMGRAAYLRVNPELEGRRFRTMQVGEIFSQVALLDMRIEEALASPAEWNKRFGEKVFGDEELSLITSSLLWAEDLPPEVLKAAEIHDHLCPGLLSGFFIVKTVLEELPVREGTEYFVISSPVWCKDDLFQSVLNTTPGKHNLVVLPLSEEEREHLQDPNAAGIFVQLDRKIGGGRGVVVGFDWGRLQKDAGAGGDWSSWKWRLQLGLFMARHLSDWSRYAYVIKRFELKEGEKAADCFALGSNPWKKLGLWRE